jgi:hypothetical protein
VRSPTVAPTAKAESSDASHRGMTVEGTAGEARDVLDRGNAPLQAVPTVPTTNARRESRVALVVALRGGTFAMLRLVDVCHQQKRNFASESSPDWLCPSDRV